MPKFTKYMRADTDWTLALVAPDDGYHVQVTCDVSLRFAITADQAPPSDAPNLADSVNPGGAISVSAGAYLWLAGYPASADCILNGDSFTAEQFSVLNALEAGARASESEEMAASAAQRALDSEGLARDWAENPEDAPVVEGRYSSLHHAQKAQGAAQSAQTARDGAERFADASEASGLRAAGSEVGARTSANEARQYALQTAQYPLGATFPVPSAFVGGTHVGQSNMGGLNNMGDLPVSAQGVFPRVQIFERLHLDDPVQAVIRDFTIIASGVTADGVTGYVAESDDSAGVSSITGLAQMVPDEAGSGLYGSAAGMLVVKEAKAGRPMGDFLPGGARFVDLERQFYEMVDPYVRANPTLWGHISYAQGERESRNSRDQAESSTGVTDWQTVVPVALQNAEITGWASRFSEGRRIYREHVGHPDLPFCFLGFVLPSDSDTYFDTLERLREAVAIQQQNMSRWLVRLSDDGESITLTDLAGPQRSVAWDVATDSPVITDDGAAPHRDDNTYYIDARGYETPDNLHHASLAQLKIGKAVGLLLQHIYGGDGTPPESRRVAAIPPVLHAPPTYTGGRLSLAPSIDCMAAIVALPVGQTPGAAEILADPQATFLPLVGGVTSAPEIARAAGTELHIALTHDGAVSVPYRT